MVERHRAIRRGFHSLSSLFVVYYWLPPYIEPLQLSREYVALLGLFLLTAFEAYRMHRGWVFFGLRDYEKKWIAGYYWGAFGYVLALLFFEPRFAIITILGTTLVDPILGELRASSAKRWALPGGFGAWCAVASVCILAANLGTPWLFVPLGAALAVGAEGVKTRFVDDNFLMNIVPLLSLTALAAAVRV